MLDRLGEFERSSGRQLGSAAFALVLHVALIFLAIRATNAAAAAARWLGEGRLLAKTLGTGNIAGPV